MTIQFKNNASTTLSGSINDTQTTLTVASSGGFPVLSGSDVFYATMYEVSAGVEINIEIVKVTGTAGVNWTIVRGQDGTSSRARSGVDTCYIELRWTAATALAMLQKENNLSDLASASAARTNLGLGTLATQDASAVNITGGTITGVTINSLDSTTRFVDNGDPTKQLAFEVSGVATGTTRTLTVPNASGTIALLSDLSAGYQPLDSDLTALAALAANGLIARTGSGAVAVRTIGVPAAGLTITNGDGVSGNPTLALADDLAAVEALSTTGFVRRTGVNTWSASAILDGDLPSALTSKTYNNLTLTANASGFSVAGGTASKTLTVQNSMTFAGTDGTTLTFPSVTGTIPLNNQTFFLGTTSIAINRASGAIALTGITSIDGSAASATTAGSATTATNLSGGGANRIPYQTGSGATGFVTAPVSSNTYLRWNGTAFDWATTTSGSVTSVAVSSSDLSVTGSPITSSGTISLSLNTVGIAKGGTGQTTKTAAFDALSPTTTLGDLIYSDGTNNVRLAGSTSSSRRFLRQTGTGTVSAAPAWDGLVDGDIPAALTGKTYNGLTLTAATTGFTIAGGTSSKTLTVSNTLTLAGTDASTLNIGAGGTLGSAAFTASTAYAPSVGSASITTLGTIGTGTWQGSAIGISYGGTGQTSKTAAFNALTPSTTLGDINYHNGSNAVRLAGNTTTSKRFLTQTGTGSVSAAPGWNAIVDGDIPSALTGKTYNGLTLTANATGFQIAGGTTSKTLTVSNNLTLAGTDGSTLNIGAGGTLGTGAYATIANYAALSGATFTGAISSTTYTATGTSAAVNFQDRSNTSNSWGLYSTGSTFKLLWQSASNPGDKLTVDSSGNLSTAGANTALGTPMLSSLATSHVCLPQFPVLSSLSQSIVLACNARYAAPWTTNSTGASGMYSIDGNVHTWNGAASLAANSTITFTQQMSLSASSDLTVTGNVTAYSDERLKKDWDDLPSDFITKLADVKTGTYTRIDNDVRQIGVSAQSLQSVAPEGVIDGEKYLSVAYGNVALAAAVALARKVVELEARLSALEA